jgi:hypothetical protein
MSRMAGAFAVRAVDAVKTHFGANSLYHCRKAPHAAHPGFASAV